MKDFFNSFIDVTKLVFTNRFHYISESCIENHIKKFCILDYAFDDDEIKYFLSKSRVRDIVFNFLSWLIRCIIDFNINNIISLCQTTSLRVELKFKHFKINVFLIIFDYHDSNFFDIIKVLQHFEDFDEDINILINDEKIFFCVFIHIFVNDISQQQKNSNFKS